VAVVAGAGVVAVVVAVVAGVCIAINTSSSGVAEMKIVFLLISLSSIFI